MSGGASQSRGLAIGRVGRAALAAGLVGVAAVLAAALIDPVSGGAYALAGWLAASLAVGAIPIGATLILLIHQVMGGGWIRALERPLVAAALSLPALAPAFLPLLLGLDAVFTWAAPGAEFEPHIAEKMPWLNPWFFIARTVLYLAILIAVALVTVRGDRAERRPAENRLMGGLGLIVLTVTLSFMAVDWVLTLDPHFNSSVIGLLFVHSCVLAGFGFAVIAGLGFRERGRPLAEPAPGTVRALGALAVAGALMWIYLAFFQFLVIWSADLPHEAAWYLARSQGVWLWALWFVVLANGVFPLLALAPTAARGKAGWILVVAGAILAARLVDIAWMTVPSVHGSAVWAAVPTLAAMIGLGGLWLALVCRLIVRRTPEEATERRAADPKEAAQHG